MSETSNLALPFIEASQAQKHVTHNDALRQLDMLVQVHAVSKSVNNPPAVPQEGIVYLAAAGATGDWQTKENHIAAYQDGVWRFHFPQIGFRVWVEDEAILAYWNGSDWVDLLANSAALENLPLLGINTTADTTNKLAVASDAVLFNHAGDGIQHKLNKNTVSDTASVLFQTGFSGRAEIGLAGDDDFHFKVSPDGSTWHDSFMIEGASGQLHFNKGAYIGSQANNHNVFPGPNGFEIGGTDGSFSINVQDGDGRMNMRWNASAGTPKFSTTGDRAWELDIDGVGGFGMCLRESTIAGAEGSDVAWTNVMEVGPAGFRWMGSNVLREGGIGGPAGRLGGQVIAITCSRNGGTGIGKKFAMGNGANDLLGTAVPFAGKLLAATLAVSKGTNGVFSVAILHNGVVNNAYQMSATYAGALITDAQDFQSAPLALNAGDVLNWEVIGTPATNMGAVITFYVVFD